MSDKLVPARQSASVVIVRDAAQSLEVLLLRRNQKIAFHGGEWVFPGGRVDADDKHNDSDAELDIARRAATREAFEEAGLRLATDALEPFAHWTTPEGMPKRFATWFFVADVAHETPVTIDNSEIVDHRWLSPVDALRLHRDGEIGLPPPTFITLLGLCDFADVAAAMMNFRESQVERFEPRLIKFDGGRCTIYREDAGYESCDLDVPGARHRLLIKGNDFQYLREF